jgi:DnaJ-class molecular chaperone
MKLIECYFETSYLLVKLLLPDPALLHAQDKITTPLGIPPHLQAEYSLLHLRAEMSLAEVRAQYRELAKLYHPDAGGQHAYFLALQQAYERVIEYLQARG